MDHGHEPLSCCHQYWRPPPPKPILPARPLSTRWKWTASHFRSLAHFKHPTTLPFKAAPPPIVPTPRRYDLATEFNEALEHALDRGKNTKIMLKVSDVGVQY